MKLSIQHTLLPGTDLQDKLRRAQGYGFAGVELTAWGFEGPMTAHTDAIRAAQQATGMTISSLCTTLTDDFVHPDRAEREHRLAGLVELLKLADAIGARGVIALPLRPPLRLPDLWPVADQKTVTDDLTVALLRLALERTADCRAAIFLEPLNRFEAEYLKTVGHAAALCEVAGDPRAQVMADFFHMNIEEAGISTALAAVVARVGHVHLADNNRQLPGLGATDFVAPFRVLRQAGYEGWLALECSVPGYAVDTPPPDETIPAAVQFLQNAWAEAGR